MARACAGLATPAATAGRCRRRGSAPLADVVAGLQAAIEHFTPPGTPGRPPHPGLHAVPAPCPAALGRELIEVPMVERDGRMTYDLDGIAARVRRRRRGWWCTSTRTTRSAGCSTSRSSSPSPTSSTAAGARVFSDEIHAPLVHPGAVHRPYASLSPETARHTRHGDVDVQGLEPARPQGGAADPVERRGRRALGAGRLPVRARRRPRSGVLAATAAYDEGGPMAGRRPDLPRRQPAAARPTCSPSACRRSGTRRRRAPTWPGWTAGGSAWTGRPGAFFLERAGVALVDGPECGAPGAGHVRLNFATPAAGAHDDRRPHGGRRAGALTRVRRPAAGRPH